MKVITLCADDYGQNESVSQGVLQLIKSGRLSAVSCMTNYEHWPHYAAQLTEVKNDQDIRARLDIGLHFDLTQFIQTQGWSFNQFIIKCCFNQVDLVAIENELNHQLDNFEHQLHMPPDFIDGHQHVHAFPQIRKVFLQIIAQRYGKNLPYIRWSAPAIKGHDSFIKAIILRTLVTGFATRARQFGFKFPTQFLGMYSLRPTHYAQLFARWLTQAGNGALFMCHPGLASSDPADPIKKARLVEFNYFNSDAFSKDLARHDIQLGRWNPDIVR